MWFLPTHGRPERCQKMLDRVTDLGPSERGLLIVNAGPRQDDYGSVRLPPGWEVLYLAEDTRLAPTLNLILALYPDEPWYGIITDDQIPTTPGWDILLPKALGNGTFIVSSNDGWQAPNRLHGALVFDGDFIRKVGYFAPPGFVHMFVDDVWETLASRLRCARFVMDVMVEHHHHINNKSAMDAVYERGQSAMVVDRQNYTNWLKDGLPEVLAKFSVSKKLDLTGVSLMIAVPCHGNRLYSQCAYGLLSIVGQLAMRRLSHRVVLMPDESLITRARNEALERFLASDSTHLLFVDADMEFVADDVFRLLAAKQDFVAAAGVRRVDGPLHFCINGQNMVVDKETGLCEADAVGGAFVLLSRACAERMRAAYPEFSYKDKDDPNLTRLMLYDTGLVDGHFMSEDFLFCRRWRAIGGRVMVDPTIELGHVGERAYRGRLLDVFRSSDPKMFANVTELRPAKEAAE